MIWQSPTEASVRAAVQYYHDALEVPIHFKVGLAALTGVCALATLAKLAKGTTSRILFDGGSLSERHFWTESPQRASKGVQVTMLMSRHASSSSSSSHAPASIVQCS